MALQIQANASGTWSIRQFQLPETLHLHPSVQNEVLRSSWSIPGWYYKGQLHFVHLKGSALDCFEPELLDPIESIWLSDLKPFYQGTWNQFWNLWSVSEAEAELKGLCMHESHQATKYFIKFQQLATRIQWGEAASADRLTMDSPNISKMTWSTMISQTPFPASGNLSKLSMHKLLGKKQWSILQNSHCWKPPEQDQTEKVWGTFSVWCGCSMYDHTDTSKICGVRRGK